MEQQLKNGATTQKGNNNSKMEFLVVLVDRGCALSNLAFSDS